MIPFSFPYIQIKVGVMHFVDPPGEWRRKQGTLCQIECHPHDNYEQLFEKAIKHLIQIMPELQANSLTNNHRIKLDWIPSTTERFTVHGYAKHFKLKYKELKLYVPHNGNYFENYY